jgi:hypothetical protein
MTETAGQVQRSGLLLGKANVLIFNSYAEDMKYIIVPMQLYGANCDTPRRGTHSLPKFHGLNDQVDVEVASESSEVTNCCQEQKHIDHTVL